MESFSSSAWKFQATWQAPVRLQTTLLELTEKKDIGKVLSWKAATQEVRRHSRVKLGNPGRSDSMILHSLCVEDTTLSVKLLGKVLGKQWTSIIDSWRGVPEGVPSTLGGKAT